MTISKDRNAIYSIVCQLFCCTLDGWSAQGWDIWFHNPGTQHGSQTGLSIQRNEVAPSDGVTGLQAYIQSVTIQHFLKAFLSLSISKLLEFSWQDEEFKHSHTFGSVLFFLRNLKFLCLWDVTFTCNHCWLVTSQYNPGPYQFLPIQYSAVYSTLSNSM